MITGIAWDHRRCWGPLEASIEPYGKLTGEAVRWDRRSLYSFGEGELGTYAEQYDLVIYDHPFVGDICDKGWMLDLRPLLSPEQIAQFNADEVGASWRSYAYRDGIWGLPVDTAAQTSAARLDLVGKLGLDIPKTLAEVRSFAEAAKRQDMFVGWPAVPTDLMCTLVSIAASLGLNPGHADGDFLPAADASEVIGELQALARLAHPKSKEWNPIRCLDHMSSQDDVAYVPYLFNYVNYSTGNPPRKITFGAAPATRASLQPHTILGGAGIGISAKAKDPEAAFAYAMWLCAPDYQSGDYVRFGGQPGSRSAWTSAACNALTGDFFASTLATLDNAYLRPTHPGFVPFFHDATLKLAAVLLEDAPQRGFVDWLNGAYGRLRPARGIGQ